MTETIVHLKPTDQWRPGMTLDRLRTEMGRAAELPGVTNIWTMPIINRIDMLSTGVRSEVGVKVYGSDLPMLEQTARQVANVLRTVPGAANVYPEPLTSSQYLNVRIDRERAARYGLTVAAVQDVIRTAIGERNLTLTLEGRQRFPVRVRYASEYRSDPQALGNVLVASPSGQQIPLAQVADIEQARGPGHRGRPAHPQAWRRLVQRSVPVEPQEHGHQAVFGVRPRAAARELRSDDGIPAEGAPLRHVWRPAGRAHTEGMHSRRLVGPDSHARRDRIMPARL